MTARSVSITFAGSGGAGVMTAGNMLLDAAGRAGWYAYMTRSSGAQIRGGEAAAMMRLSTSPVQSHDDHFDVLVAIDWQNVGRFSAEIPMTSDGLVLGDPDGGDFPEQIGAKGARCADIPFKKMAKEIEGGRPNMIALGAVAGLVGLPEDAVLGVVRDSLAKKGEAARTASEASPDQLQRAVEEEGIRQSLDNLKTFPFIAERIADGRLQLHGAWFAIATGQLMALDPASNAFVRVAVEGGIPAT